MKRLVKGGLNALGYEVHKKQDSQKFTIGEITYEVDPCSVGETPQGELTGEAAIRMIRERGLSKLRVLDICCGVGIIGMTIFSKLRRESIVERVGFVDINIFNLNSLRRTLKLNNLDQLLGDRINYWLSDSLDNVPAGEKFDLIVSNPPHFFSPDHTEGFLSPGRLGTYDADWSFHKSFYKQCHNYLTERGEVWFLENGDAVQESGLLPLIQANSNLSYVKQITEPLDPVFFWMISKKV
ncbi:MAG: methyltransferase [Pyrinomonadaceae bacterium]